MVIDSTYIPEVGLRRSRYQYIPIADEGALWDEKMVEREWYQS